MIRMLLIGYCYSIRSERRLCDEVRFNLAYRWFCGLGLEAAVPRPSRLAELSGSELTGFERMDAENEARKAKRGMWRGTFVKPWERRASAPPRVGQSSTTLAPRGMQRPPAGS
jgi:hypothetical protein